MTADDLWRIPRVGNPVASPGSQDLAVSVTTYDLEKNEGRGRIWLVPIAGGEPRAMTTTDASSDSPALSPEGDRLAFTRRIDKAKPQLYVMPIDGGEGRKLTDMPLGVFDPQWLPYGSGLIFGAMLLKGHLTPEATKAEIERREKDPVKALVTEDRFYRYWDTWLVNGEVPHLFLLDLATGTQRDLMPTSTLWFDFMEPSGQFDIAPDGRDLVLGGTFFDDGQSLVRSAIYNVSLAEGGLTCLTPDAPICRRPRFSPDGRSVLYGLRRDPRYYADPMRLWRYDRTTGQHAAVLDDWGLTPSAWTFAADGTIVMEAERNARVDLFTLAPGQTEPRPLTDFGTAQGATPLPDGAVAFKRQSLSEPGEIWRLDAGAREPIRLSRFTAETSASFATGEVREITFEGAYGQAVQMFVVLPPDYVSGTTYPLVQVIHGGPHGVSGDLFSPRWNAHLFAAPGYVAALVNFQGSTSWGDTFTRSILGAWGDRPYQDVMCATDVLIASGLVDESRMAAAGGSYGGYMASWIEAQTDRFRCIVNHAGVYDTLAQYASDITQGRSLSFGGEPWDGLDVIDRWNPARFASGFNTPMLVIHGERDFRVPVTQGLECYGVLKAKGVPARLVYFPDENHWVLKPQNSLLWHREVHNWLKRYLDA
jgi:dipeptidyl aminopeptidase/acylaminoacyl peptidase